jgi:NIMA (never in mitosis gene a)-related kinase
MNDFKIISKLGEGAYSTVYKVKRIVDNNIYALKKVKLLNLSEKEKQNSLNEVRLLASINSNYVISYKEAFFDEKDSTLGIVMEFADRGDLYQKIVEHKKSAMFFEETDIWRIFIQLVKGLKALHDLKILHRDLKSANVFLLSDGTAKLGDLNVSKVVRRGLGYTQTGTPYYASPEVWKDQPYDNKSDIWSLGCVLYEMITLRPPFRAQNMEGLYNKVIKGQFNRIPDRFSNELFEIVKLLIQINTDSRPSCDEILKHPIIQKRIEYFKSFAGDQENEDKALLQTIRIPKNLLFLSDKLPKPNYSKKMRSSNNAISDKLNKNNYRSYSKKSDFEIKETNKSPQNKKLNNENINNIQINNNKILLPIVRIGEQKINNNNNNSMEIINNNNNNNNNSNIKKIPENKKTPSLVYSGSQKLINNNPNKKILNVNGINLNGARKVMHKNMSSEFPSLNIINQKNRNINHLNEIYKIYSPFFDKPQLNNNKLKVYNNNNNYYLKNIQRYYKIDKQPLNIGKNYNGYHINLNRIGSGRKMMPNRKLSPIKKNIINIY